MVNKVLSIKKFPLINTISNKIPSLLWGKDISFNSEIECEPPGEYLFWYDLQNRNNAENIELRWKDDHYKLSCSNILLSQKVENYLIACYQETLTKNPFAYFDFLASIGDLEKISQLYSSEIDVSRAIFLAGSENQIDIIKYFVDYFPEALGLKVGLKSTFKSASKYGYTEILKFILSQKQLFDLKDLRLLLSSALAEATSYNQIPIVDFLIDQKAPVYIETEPQYESALHIAAQLGNVEILEKLLEIQEDIDILNQFYDTPLDLAERANQKNVIDILKAIGEKNINSFIQKLKDE